MSSWTTAPLPPDESERLAALRSYEILDTEPEREFDDLVALATYICRTPISLISLVDDERQWFKARQGLDVSSTSRDVAFCAHAILDNALFVVPDATRDPRFAANPLVLGEPHVRFYAGAPLQTPSGQNLGTLCVIDREPRKSTPDQRHALELLARQVVAQLELRRNLRDQVRSQLALHESEERLRAVTASSITALITADERALIESVNPAAEDLFGYTAAEIVGRPVAMLVTGDVGEPGAFLKGAYRKAIGRSTQWRGRRKDGSEFPFELALFEFKTRTGRSFAGHILDRTERAEIDRVKAEFVATVSHEIRTPLTSIRGALGLLAGGVMGELTPDVSTMIEVASRNCDRLMTLVNDILEVERIESGGLAMQILPVDVATIVERAVETVQAFAQQKQIEIGADVERTVFDGDARRIVQVIVNLLSNAVKFSESGARVRVRAGRRGDAVEIAVSDQGRGIPAGAIPRLFRRFQQIEAGDARRQNGAGLGLAISRAIVDQHHGSIDVESEEGAGATFTVRLPVTHRSPAVGPLVHDGRPEP